MTDNSGWMEVPMNPLVKMALNSNVKSTWETEILPLYEQNREYIQKLRKGIPNKERGLRLIKIIEENLDKIKEYENSMTYKAVSY